MLQLTMDQYEFAQYDFGRPINIKLYLEDKETLNDDTDYNGGVIQSFKRHGDGSFYPYRDVARGLSVFGIGAQIIANIDITFSVNYNTGTFTFDNTLLPTVPSYMWMKAVLFKGTSLESATKKVSSDLVRVFVEFGAPQ